MSVGGTTAGAGRCADDLRFAQLYERYYRPIRDFFARRVPRHAVDDAVADTFLTVWRCLDEVPAGEAALVWLYGVAHRVVGHQRRSVSRRGRLHERLRTVEVRPAAAADDAVADGVESRRILAALGFVLGVVLSLATALARPTEAQAVGTGSMYSAAYGDRAPAPFSTAARPGGG